VSDPRITAITDALRRRGSHVIDWDDARAAARIAVEAIDELAAALSPNPAAEDRQRRLRAWKWRRLHDATPAESYTLAEDRPDVDPASPGAGAHLTHYRTANPATTDQE
jgi:hypothetical protein